MYRNNSPNINPISDAQFNIAAGNSPGIIPFSKFGHNKDIDIGTKTIWDYSGIWQPMTGSASKLNISSSHIEDNSTGSGARTINISGVGINRAEQTENISLNGTNLVTSSLSYLGINRVTVTSVGLTGSYNYGNIIITEISGSTVQAHISGSDGITHQMIYHVPSGSNFYIRRLVIVVDKVSGGGTQPQIEVKGYVVYPNNVRIEIVNDRFEPGQRNFSDSLLNNDIIIPGSSYFWMNATTDQNNTYIRARVEGKLFY